MEEGRGNNLGQHADQLVFCSLWTKVSSNAVVPGGGSQIFQMELGQAFVCCFDRIEGPCPVPSYCVDAWMPDVEGLLTCWGKRE